MFVVAVVVVAVVVAVVVVAVVVVVVFVVVSCCSYLESLSSFCSEHLKQFLITIQFVNEAYCFRMNSSSLL